MSDIVGFLLAQLDRDEAVARAAAGEAWTNGPPATIHPNPTIYKTVRAAGASAAPVCGSILAGNAEHIARHDPARVLAEVAAKRAVVGAHRSRADLDRGGDAKICTSCADGSEIAYGDAITVWTAWPCVTLRALAGVYRGEDGWDESWALTEVGA